MIPCVSLIHSVLRSKQIHVRDFRCRECAIRRYDISDILCTVCDWCHDHVLCFDMFVAYSITFLLGFLVLIVVIIFIISLFLDVSSLGNHATASWYSSTTWNNTSWLIQSMNSGKGSWNVWRGRWMGLLEHAMDFPVFFLVTGSTLPRTNLAPGRRLSQKETHLPTPVFQVLC